MCQVTEVSSTYKLSSLLYVYTISTDFRFAKPKGASHFKIAHCDALFIGNGNRHFNRTIH